MDQTRTDFPPAFAPATPRRNEAGPVHPRDAMLTAAARLFRQRGYAGVGVAELLTESGLPRGSLYFHFPGGKQQIAIEAMLRASGRVSDNVAIAAAESADLSAFITRVFAEWSAGMTTANFARGCGVGLITLEMAAVSPELREAADGIFAAWERQLTEITGGFGLSPVAAATLASALLATIQGAIVIAKARQSAAPFETGAAAILALAAQLRAEQPSRP
jgi:TetR/AcrR family transcriptional repressor of lmrAB and yxaGH operons